ncbi:MAG: hypothetical protein QXO86_05070 [Nitrososphaerota archaeon]
MWRRTLKASPTVFVCALNLLIYTLQGLRLAAELGPAAPLVLSNLIISTLFLLALILIIFRTRRSIQALFAASLATLITYRMWSSATDPERDLYFRAAHGFMILLAWLLPATITVREDRSALRPVNA